MFISPSMGKLTGWKAVIIAVPLVAFFGFQAWETMPHYHEIDSGTWTIQAGQSMAYTFNLPEQCRIEFEITRNTPGEFQVALMEAAVFDRITNGLALSQMNDEPDGGGGPTEFIFDQTGSGTIAGRDIRLEAGKYKIVTSQADQSGMTATYKIFEFRGGK